MSDFIRFEPEGLQIVVNAAGVEKQTPFLRIDEYDWRRVLEMLRGLLGMSPVGLRLAINLLLPIRLSTLFWVWRVDLVSLPLFVAGAIALLFGVRALWRQRLPVAAA